MLPGLSTVTLLLLLFTRAAPTPAADQYVAPDALHRVPLHTVGVQPSEPLLPGAAEAFNTPKNDTVLNFQGDDDLTIAQVKDLESTITTKHTLKKRDANLTPDLENTSNEQQNRNKRDFIHWVGSSSFRNEPAQHTVVHSYQISSVLPYYIPIWGNPRRIPIFFPPKPILFNPGYPARNPPPKNGLPTTEEEATTIVIGTRAGGGDEPPIWGIVESSEVTGGGSPAQSIPSNRPTKPPTPGLFHNPTFDNNINNNVPQITTTTIPPPNFRPTSPPFTTTRRPVVQQTRPPQSQNAPPAAQDNAGAPSRCIWAVISCCSPVSTNIRYSCFEQLGCPGSFWDQNPCSREITQAALNVAQRFYQQNNAGS